MLQIPNVVQMVVGADHVFDPDLEFASQHLDVSDLDLGRLTSVLESRIDFLKLRDRTESMNGPPISWSRNCLPSLCVTTQCRYRDQPWSDELL